MLLETLFFVDEIKELPKGYVKPALSEPELEMAEALIRSMDRPFAPSAYQDEYQARLRELIQRKIQGKQLKKPRETREDNIIDLMEALQASLAQQEQAARPKRKATPKKPAKAAAARKNSPAKSPAKKKGA